MENNVTANDSNLSAKGDKGVNEELINKDTVQESTSEEVESESDGLEQNEINVDIVAESPKKDTESAEVALGSYSSLDRETLLIKLNDLIKDSSVEKIKDAVEEIKVVFYKKHKIVASEARQSFIESGGVPEDFKFGEDSLEDSFKALYGQYKVKRTVLNDRLEKDKLDNLHHEKNKLGGYYRVG